MKKNNVLILMCDQLQREPVSLDSPCITPNIDRLTTSGLTFTRAYTPNPVCSPARASLMTGQLPHNHGVLWVTHTMDKDQGQLRVDRKHWAQILNEGGYRTGYFGKWHVTDEEDPSPFGWEIDGSAHSSLMQGQGVPEKDYLFERKELTQKGYGDALFYGTTSVEAGKRRMGAFVDGALTFLENTDESPWCCMVSFFEPHDPFVCSEETLKLYENIDIPLKENRLDSMEDKPAIYRRSAEINRQLSDEDWIEATKRYYGSITESDNQFGRLLDYLDESGQRENTLIILLTDHGDFLGSHGLYCKNLGSFEEAYNIPLIMSGPGIAVGKTTSARVGLQDIYGTLLDYLGFDYEAVEDSRSFFPLLESPETREGSYTDGFSEYFGGRFLLTQRVCYRDNWKYVMNGFDYDELYDLEKDPGEMINLARNSEYEDTVTDMVRSAWSWMKRTGDDTLVNTKYPPLRIFPLGPEITRE